jgi:uncharacterized protein (TIGR02145 family)
MKRIILITYFLFSIFYFLTAQVPHSFSYQAVVRDNAGEPLSYQLTNFRISLILGSTGGPISYQETHLQTTNFFGLVNLEIGGGTVVYGDFDTLQWNAQSYYIKVEADTTGGTDYTDMGTVQLLAVPYALHAEDAASSSAIRDQDGDTKIDAEENPDEDIIRFYTSGEERLRMKGSQMEVINPQRNIFLGEGSGGNNASGVQNIFMGYLAGRDNTTGSWNIFIGDSAGVANTEGWGNTFIGDWSGTNNTTGIVNTFIGSDAGERNTLGTRNVFLGYDAGFFNSKGHRNTFLGSFAGMNNDTGSFNTYVGRAAGQNNLFGSDNVFIGDMAGRNETGSNRLYIANSETRDPLIYGEFDTPFLRFNTRRIEVKNPHQNTIIGENAGVSVLGGGNIYIGYNAAFSDTTGWDNVYIGREAGFSNATANRNVFIGSQAGYAITTGNYNVLIGMQTGWQNTTGSRNTFVGTNAGYANTTGLRNTFIGLSAGGANTSGSYNTYIGRCAGSANVDGSNNVFIGNFAGTNEMGSDKLYISNSETSEPLIYGDFAEKKLKFWADSIEASGEVRTNLRFNVNGNPGIQDTLNHITGFDFVNDKLKYRTTIYTGGIVTWLSEESGWVDTIINPIVPCGEISLVGEFNGWGGDTASMPDHMMTRDVDDPYFWTTIFKITPSNDHSEPTDNIVESKFRENQNWEINWGSFEFPSGTGYKGYGNNIPVPLNDAYDTTIYYVTFNCGTGYYTFEDLSGYCPDSITDSRDGKKYALVLIGNQCWMAQNLNTGARIDGTADQTDNSTIEKYCYNDLDSSCDEWGGLYQWDEAMGYSATEGAQGICLDGFHIPTDQELKTLEGMADSNYGVGNPEWDKTGCRGFDAGTNLKSTGGWDTGCGGTDALGFKALGTGYRFIDGSFTSSGSGSFLWSSTTYSGSGVWPRNFSCSNLICRDFDSIEYGWSVRCIKD